MTGSTSVPKDVPLYPIPERLTHNCLQYETVFYRDIYDYKYIIAAKHTNVLFYNCLDTVCKGFPLVPVLCHCAHQRRIEA